MPVQKQNAENSGLLATSFVTRKEPNYALPITIASHLALPNLRGFWPFSSINETGAAFDLSGQGRTLSNTGPVTFAVAGLLPYANFTGANYLSRADEAGLDITGALTVGGWFYTAAFAASQVLLSKFGAAGQRAWEIYVDTTSDVHFTLSTDGTAVVTKATTTAPFSGSVWHFVACRFTPSTELAVFVDGAKETNVVGIPATIFNSNAAFEIAAHAAGGALLTGRGALCFMCASALSDAIVTNIYQQGRGIFGL